MSEEKWTQGEWEKDRNNCHAGSIATIQHCLGSDWVEIWSRDWPATEEEQEANADLMLAAPKLYNALKAAMEFIDANVGDPDLTGEMVEAWSRLQDAKPHEALADARGES